eukprot:gene3605-4129_t
MTLSSAKEAPAHQQLVTLLYKQWLLLIRYKVISFIRFTAPLWALLIYLIVAKSLGKTHLETYEPTSVVFEYKTNTLISSIGQSMGWSASQMTPVPVDYMDDPEGLFLAQFKNQVPSSFASVFFYSVNSTSMKYEISYYKNDLQPKNSLIMTGFNNYGVDTEDNYAYAVRVAIESAIVSQYTKGAATIEVQSKKPPSLLTTGDSRGGSRVFSMFFPLFLSFGMTFPFILFVYLIVEEKERKIRSYLRSFGVIDTVYFATWLIDGLLMTLVHTIIILIFGHAAKFTFVTHTSTSVIFVVLMTYGLSLIALAILISSLISRTKAAMIIAVVVFCISLGASVFLCIMGSTFYSLYTTIDKYYYWLTVFIVLTPLGFLKVLQDIGLKVINVDFTSLSGSTVPQYFYWSNMFDNISNTGATRHITTTYNSVNYIFIATLIYLLLSWYFDKIIPDDFGGRKHPLFFVFKSYWFPSALPYPIEPHHLHVNMDSTDPDIVGAAQGVDVNNVSDYSLIIRNLSKKYGSKRVVNNLNLNVEKGKIIALLGHNGAGKTTTINMLTGQTTLTSGQVFLHGYDVASQMDHIKSLVGLCPQFDVYWPDFTAREHLTIMTLVKERRDNIKEDINNILKSVRLSSVGDHVVSSYSGGMRRRLSVAMAIIGSPQIVVLDEPTTGIDPANRRYIWRLIKEIRKDRLVLLTTHSMEEADALGDKIIIMNAGKLSGVGTSLHLKNRYGTGYKLHLVCTDVETGKEIVKSRLPDASLVRVNSNNLIYSIPSMEMLSSFLKYLTLDKEAEKIITDWQIQNSSLEDVFLSMVNH